MVDDGTLVNIEINQILIHDDDDYYDLIILYYNFDDYKPIKINEIHIVNILYKQNFLKIHNRDRINDNIHQCNPVRQNQIN